jgi:F-type H+-transporting ATPase subunit delta
MASKRVASRYAKALLGFASERNELDRIEADLLTINSLLDASREFKLLLINPVVKPDKKKSILQAIFKDGISELTLGFIKILVSKGREVLLPEIVAEALYQLRLIKNIQTAEVSSAIPLEDSTRAKILAEVAKVHDGVIELNETVDPGLLGGFVLRMDEGKVGASLRRRLTALGRRLTERGCGPEI